MVKRCVCGVDHMIHVPPPLVYPLQRIIIIFLIRARHHDGLRKFRVTLAMSLGGAEVLRATYIRFAVAQVRSERFCRKPHVDRFEAKSGFEWPGFERF